MSLFKNGYKIEAIQEPSEDKIERFYQIHSPILLENYNKLTEWAPFSLILEAKTLMYVSHGDWSAHDLLYYLLRHIGPSTLYFSTWDISETAVRLLFEAKKAGLLNKVYAVVDKRLESKNSGVNTLLDKIITEKVAVDCHAKVFLIEGEEYSIVNCGSADMTDNHLIETGVVSTDEEAIELHKNWIMREIKKGRDEFDSINRGE